MEQLFSTREEWLALAFDEWNRRVFKQVGRDLDPHKIKVSCGFPPGARGNKNAFAVLPPAYSKAGNTEVFINPVMEKELDVSMVVGVAAAVAVGLVTGKNASADGVTSAMSWSPLDYLDHAKAVGRELGKYPHAKLDLAKIPKQTTRLIKCKCDQCGYTVRITKKWIGKGVPNCPTHKFQPLSPQDME